MTDEKITLKIGGMSCAACVRTVENSLKKVKGVATIQVNLAVEKALVEYNPQLASLLDIKKAIEDAGYEYLGTEAEKDKNEKRAREQDLAAKRNRFIIGLIAGIILMIMGFLPVFLPFPIAYLMLTISSPVFIYVSYPVFSAAYRSLKYRNLSMDVMYAMGIGISFIASVLATFEILLSRDSLFYDTAILLASFLMIGRYLESRARSRTSESIKKLMHLQPKTATLLRMNQSRNVEEKIVAIEEVQLDDILFVKPGEQIPADGIVTEGESYVDQSMITGEPIPVLKKSGENIFSGTLNTNSVLRIRVTKIGKETMLAQIIQLVEHAQMAKPPIQRIADRVVNYFIPAILGLAIFVFITWQAIGSTLAFALTCAISVLVIACPCALGLATPTAITVGLGRGAELGILIKSGEALEKCEKLDTIIFDKTGTLTAGRAEVAAIIPYDIDERDLLQLSASAERNSVHPLAEAIVRKAQEHGIKLLDAQSFDTIQGKGVTAIIENKKVLIGSKAFFQESGISLSDNDQRQIEEFEDSAQTVILIAIDNIFRGIIAISDLIKPNVKDAVQALKKMNINVYMITGDNARTAKIIARTLQIDNVLAEALPQDKALEVKSLKEHGHVVAFVGDGINDAPALAEADVGIALGRGTDIAIESGDIVLVKDNVMDAVSAIQLSRKVMSRIKQNLFWAFAYNTALIPLAAGLLYPFFGITLKPEFAGLAMAMSSVTVVTLSLFLKKFTPHF